ncbi:hypothetical protein [Lactobacillus sp. B4005]|uniref:hypothetical protein n=1 Tax=Lactobacillus sp. B4005 TaxID=2818031 RepID=UPI0022699CB1|nr:hypothetical protein [Lactobacillus sp. B4005]MCX8724280.1 hypothetical protein [Lactobacillus sp. B4005]
MKSISKLEIGYYLPLVTLVEIVSILITVLIQPYSLSGLLNNVKQTIIVTTLLMLVILLAMLVITIQYQRGNTFKNYCSSVVQTYNLRRFSKVQPKTTQVKVGNEWKNQPINDPTEKAFNQAIQGWYIDRRKNSLIVWLFLPKTSSAINKLDQELPTILTQIKENNPEYIFSSHERTGNYYKVEATRY